MDNEQIWSDLRLQALLSEEMSKDIKSFVRNKNQVAAGLDAGNMLRQAQEFFDLVLQLPRQIQANSGWFPGAIPAHPDLSGGLANEA